MCRGYRFTQHNLVFRTVLTALWGSTVHSLLVSPDRRPALHRDPRSSSEPRDRHSLEDFSSWLYVWFALLLVTTMLSLLLFRALT